MSVTNHFMLQGGGAWKGKLARLAILTLVIHGTVDPIFPIQHGELLAETIEGTKLVRIEGGGHEMHPQDWGNILSNIELQTTR